MLDLLIGLVKLVLILIGLGSAYSGFKIHELYLWFIGFIVGVQLTIIITIDLVVMMFDSVYAPIHVLSVLTESFPRLVVLLFLLGILVMGGLIGGAMILALERLVVAFIGFIGGLLVALIFPGNSLLWGFFLGIAGGALAWISYVGAIIFVTSVFGAFLISSMWGDGAFVVVFLSGVAVQSVWYSQGVSSKNSIEAPAWPEPDRSSERTLGSDLVWGGDQKSMASNHLDGFEPRKLISDVASDISKQQSASSEAESVSCLSCGARNDASNGICHYCEEEL